MQNSKYDEKYSTDPFYPRNVIVITQFEEKMNSQRVLKFMKDWQNANTKESKVSLKGFHFRLAEEGKALELSGYKYNAITPFFMDAGG